MHWRTVRPHGRRIQEKGVEMGLFRHWPVRVRVALVLWIKALLCGRSGSFDHADHSCAERDISRVRQSGALRLFVSSTFRDMQSERDALVARAFPELRALAAKSGRPFQEVDLRW